VESRIKLLGHPVHPMLIVYPLGLLSMAVIFDIVYVLTGNGDLATFSFWALVAGIIGGLAAAVFGFIDWLAIPADTRARRIGLFHGGGNLVVVFAFALSLAARWNQPAYLPSVVPLVLAIAGGLIAILTAWLGGELVYRLRVGVDDEANLNAPNSLAEDGPVEVKA
jgi:uncharacterized membrane protein